MRVIFIGDTHYRSEISSRHEDFFAKILSENPDVICHAGDWIVNQQWQLNRSVELLRKCIPDIPIIAVRGNHDFWGIGRGDENFHLTMGNHRRLFSDYNITHLDGSSIVINGVLFCGFDGWYSSLNPPTNDKKIIPTQINGLLGMDYLQRKSITDFGSVLNEAQKSKYEGMKKVLVTHFPTFIENYTDDGFGAPPGWHQFVTKYFDVAHFGHTHARIENLIMEKCSVNNAGAGTYDKPSLNHITLEL